MFLVVFLVSPSACLACLVSWISSECPLCPWYLGCPRFPWFPWYTFCPWLNTISKLSLSLSQSSSSMLLHSKLSSRFPSLVPESENFIAPTYYLIEIQSRWQSIRLIGTCWKDHVKVRRFFYSLRESPQRTSRNLYSRSSPSRSARFWLLIVNSHLKPKAVSHTIHYDKISMCRISKVILTNSFFVSCKLRAMHKLYLNTSPSITQSIFTTIWTLDSQITQNHASFPFYSTQPILRQTTPP